MYIGADAAAIIPHSNLVVKLRVTDHKFVRRGLPMIATDSISANERQSPYNPRVRLLSNEQPQSATSSTTETRQTATLLSQTPITPTISRFTFSLTNPASSTSAPTATWKPGQYVLLDFSSELYEGYSHMRDDDPRSLNDDFVRSFTVSSPPPSQPGPPHSSVPNDSTSAAKDESRGTTFTLTLRKIANGPVTSYLFRQGIASSSRSNNNASPVEIAVAGFAGSFRFDIAKAMGSKKEGGSGRLVYVCSGVGVTPLLGQVEGLAAATGMGEGGKRKEEEEGKEGLLKRLVVFWTLSVRDLPFAVDTLRRHPKLSEAEIRIFVTGLTDATDGDAHIKQLLEHNIIVIKRRFEEGDFAILKRGGQADGSEESDSGSTQEDQIHICANPKLTQLLREWMVKLAVDGEVVSEDFAY